MKRFITSLLVFSAATQLHAQNWLTTGNAGTTSANFIGTTDAQSLRFRTNNQVSGIIDYSATSANTSLGFQSLRLNTGNNNAAFGYRSMWSNTSGRVNTALGAYSMYNNTTGFSNTALGIAALFSGKTLRNTVAVGDSALYYTTSGPRNTAVGSKALCLNTSGSNNTSMGFEALYGNVSGGFNTAVGYNALRENGFGNSNTAVGASALEKSQFGFNNVAVGNLALLFDSAGYINTAIGTQSMYLNGDGDYNVGVGHQSLYNTISDKNSAVGVFALYANTTGSFNTSIGYSSSCTLPNLTNATALGALSSVTASNQVRVGNSAVTSIGGFANWTNVSDGRVKKNIKENVPGLLFINKLKPVTYNLDLDAADKIIQRPEIKDAAGKTIATTQEELKARDDKQKILYSGFVAQQVEQAAKSIGYDFSGVDAAKNEKDLYGLRYAEFVVPLVKAVQELSAANDAKDAAIKDLQTKYDALEAKLNAVLAVNTNSSVSNNSSLNIQSSSLKISPNPTTGNAMLNLSNYNERVTVKVADAGGKIIWQTNTADNSIIIPSQKFSGGVYVVSVISSKGVEATKMVKE